MNNASRKPGKRGYVLITAAMFALAFAGALALAVDFGRMYAMKSLLQAQADAAALAGAVQLDGTPQGVEDAAAAVRQMAGQQTAVQAEFSDEAPGPWTAAASASANSRFVRVQLKAQTPLFFMSVLEPEAAGSMAAAAAAGQVESPAAVRNADPEACSAERLSARVAQDSDRSSRTYEEYAKSGQGNGRRIVLCRDGESAGAYFAGLRGGGGQQVGAHVLGSRRRGAAKTGAYVVRLVD